MCITVGEYDVRMQFARRITQTEIHEEHTDPEYAVHLQQIVQKVDQQTLCHFLSENDFESDICKRIDKLRHDSP